MIISCPSCSAKYYADNEIIGKTGRNVRCAACGHSWFMKPELTLEDRMRNSSMTRANLERQRRGKPAMAPHNAIRERRKAKAAKERMIATIGAWAMSASLFVMIGFVTIIHRDDITRNWPKASAAYAAMGLEVNRFGLEFADIKAYRGFDGNLPILAVQGYAINSTKHNLPVPYVRISLRNDKGQEVIALNTEIETDGPISPGQKVNFTRRLDSPPRDTFDLTLNFIDPPKLHQLPISMQTANNKIYDQETHNKPSEDSDKEQLNPH